MPKKFGENSKAAVGRERKAAQETERKSKKQAELDRKEDEEWNKGAKKGGKKESEEAKRAARLAKKSELDELKRQDDQETAKLKRVAASKQPQRVEEKRNQRNVRKAEDRGKQLDDSIITLNADNLEDALDALDIASGKSAVPGSSGAPDRHVERRVRAAYAAYEERELPNIRQENPGLRLTQQKQLLWKQWQKSPENPLNQASLSYNASRDEEKAFIDEQRTTTEHRLKG